MDSRAFRLSRCGAQAELPWDMWDPPRLGIEPVFPALASGYLTTEPPGKSITIYFRHNDLKKYSTYVAQLCGEELPGGFWKETGATEKTGKAGKVS